MEKEILHHLLSDYVLPLDLGNTGAGILEQAFDAKVPLWNIGATLGKNQFYLGCLRDVASQHRKQTKFLETEREGLDTENLSASQVCALFGRHQTRDFVAATRMLTMTGGDLPRAEGASLQIDAAAQLKHSRAVEEYCLEERVAFSGMAFSSALVYDWMWALAKQKSIKQVHLTYFEDVWKGAFRQARLANELGREMEVLVLDEYVFGAALLMDVGKILLSVTFEEGRNGMNWGQFESKYAELFRMAPEVRVNMEQEQFGASCDEISALVARFHNFLWPVEQVIQYSAEPYFLRKINKKLFRLGVLLYFARRLSIIEKAHEYGSWGLRWSESQKGWLKELGLSEKTLKKALERVI